MSNNGPGQSAQCVAVLDRIDFLLRVEPLSEGVDQIEPLLEDLLQSIARHGECRAALEVRFEELLNDLPGGAVEILQYCMHELRWRGVEEYAKSRLDGETRVVRRRSLERILEAFDDNWSERDLYARFEGGSANYK